MGKVYIHPKYPLVYTFSKYDIQLTPNLVDQMWCYFCLHDTYYAMDDPPDVEHFQDRFWADKFSQETRYIELFHEKFRFLFIELIKSTNSTLKFIFSDNEIYIIEQKHKGHYTSKWASTHPMIIEQLNNDIVKSKLYGKWVIVELFLQSSSDT